jgi:hypothetical protein
MLSHFYKYIVMRHFDMWFCNFKGGQIIPTSRRSIHPSRIWNLQAYNFLHLYANDIWGVKCLEGPPLSILTTFLKQQVSIILQKMQAFTILNWAIMVGLATSWLPPLVNSTPPNNYFYTLGVGKDFLYN